MDYHFIVKNSPLQRLCDEYNSTIIGYQPYNQALLLGKYSSQNLPTFEDGDHRAKLDKFSKNSIEYINEKLEQLKVRFGNGRDDLAAVANRFVLNHSNISAVVVGFRNLTQVKETLKKSPYLELNGEDMRLLNNLFRKW